MDVSFQRKNYTSSIFCSKHLVAAIVLRLSYYIVLQRLFISFGSVYSLTTYVDKPFVRSYWSNANLNRLLVKILGCIHSVPKKVLPINNVLPSHLGAQTNVYMKNNPICLLKPKVSICYGPEKRMDYVQGTGSRIFKLSSVW